MGLQIRASKCTWRLREGVDKILRTSIGIAHGNGISTYGKVKEVLLGSSGIPKEGVGLGTTANV